MGAPTRRRAWAVSIALVGVIGMSPTPTKAAEVRECGDAGTLYGGALRIKNVTTRGVRCSYAKYFARSLTYRGGPVCDEDLVCRFRGWRCVSRAHGHQVDRRCTKGQRYVIRFQDE